MTVSQTIAPDSSANLAIIDSDLYIGNSANLNRGWDGYIDEFAIWKRILTATEAYKIYGAVKADSLYDTALVDTDLAAWWRMGEYLDTNKRSYDESGLKRHAEGFNLGLNLLDETKPSYHKK